MQIKQKRYQYWSGGGVKWTKWFETTAFDEEWQIKNKLRNEYREVKAVKINPEDLISFIHSEGMVDSKTEKKILKHFDKLKGLLTIYIHKSDVECDNAEKVVTLCKYLDDEMKKTVINFIKKVK